MTSNKMEKLEQETAALRAQLRQLKKDRSTAEDENTFLACQNQVLEMLAAGHPLQKIIIALILCVEVHSPDVLGSVLTLDPQRKRLRVLAAPSLPDTYNQAIDNLEIGPKVGSCGTAAFHGETAIVENIQVDPLWENYRHLAAKHSLRACWSQPIFSSNSDVLGTFALYHKHPKRPTHTERDLLRRAAFLASVAIERRQMITEPRLEEDLVKQQLAEIDELYKSSSVGLCLMDTELRFLRINEHLAAINGRPVSEHVGKTLREILPDLADSLEPIYREVVNSGQPALDFEIRGFTPADPKNERVWIVSYYPIKSSDGVVEALSTIVQDVTEFKKIEADLRASEERFRTICENAPVMIDVFDQEGRCLFLNRELEKTLGWSAEEFQSSDDPLSLMYPDKRVRDQVLESIRRADGDFREYRVTSKDGSTCIQMWANFRLANDSLISVGYDVTERKERNEAQKKHSQDLEKLVEERTKRIRALEEQRSEIARLAATGRIAATIAHEINNPLAGLKNAFFLIKSSLTRDHKHYDYVQRIDEEIDRIRDIVHQLYEIYQPAYQQPTNFDVANAVNETCQIINSQASKRQVKIQTTFGKTVASAFLPLGHFKQILHNVIQNAVEASPQASAVNVNVSEDKGMLVIEVVDQGNGIPVEIASKIYDPFFTTKERGQGENLGLGLSVTKNLVTLMSGKISASSSAREGTAFTIVLPVSYSKGEQ